MAVVYSKHDDSVNHGCDWQDLGCGPGNLTKFLRAAWPDAHIVSVDSSQEMLDAGRAAAEAEGVNNVEWVKASIEEFESKEQADVIFSNAALHWVPDHAKLLPRVCANLAPGGVLAFQIPDTRKYGGAVGTIAQTHQANAFCGCSLFIRQASHLLMETAAATCGVDVSGVRIPRCEEDPGFYVEVLGRLTDGGEMGVNTWSTEYSQMLTGDNPVADYTRSTGFQPMLAAAGGEGSESGAKFESEYRKLIAEAYPKLGSGVTVFPFKRFFVVAKMADK